MLRRGNASRQAARKNGLTGCCRQADQDLFEAQGALAQKSWDEARRIVSGVLSRIETESDGRLASVRVRAESLDRRGSARPRGTDGDGAGPNPIPPFPRFSRRGPLS